MLPKEKTRCEATVAVNSMREATWRGQRYGEPFVNRCFHDAVVEIDGKGYCRLHGGHIALDKLLKGELVEKKK